MVRPLLERIDNEQGGFTLIELLAVILIIGILAAIALPAFLGQRQKGQDAEAKSNARSIVSHLESCFTDDHTYVGCDTSQDVTDSGIPIGPGAGEVSISGLAADGYTVVGHSKASGHNFTIEKTGGGSPTRSCVPVGKGACPSTGATDW
jgi:type IV pilus assembly protein PilA